MNPYHTYLTRSLVDLHLGNIGIALPTLADVDPDDVLSEIGNYEVTMVLPTDPNLVSTSLPRYLVSPCNLSPYFDSVSSNDEIPLEPEAKLFDFGAGASFFHSILTSYC